MSCCATVRSQLYQSFCAHNISFLGFYACGSAQHAAQAATSAHGMLKPVVLLLDP